MGPHGNSSSFQHKPKLEDDYRTKNIHKHKRLHGSNVISPRTEKELAKQDKYLGRADIPKFDSNLPLMNPSQLMTLPPIMDIHDAFKDDQEMKSNDGSRSNSRSKYKHRRSHSKESKSRSRRHSPSSEEYDSYK